MNYKKHYDSLIEKAKLRLIEKGIYVENHHIIPRSEGGNDNPHNLVQLTAREHFLAHWLLYRDDPTIDSRSFSFWRMCNGRGKVSVENWITIPSRVYEEARIAHSAAISRSLKGRKKTAEHVEKVAAANRGQKRTKEAKEKMSVAKKNKPLTQSHKDNMKGRVPWNKGIPFTKEQSLKQSQSLTGNNNAGKSCYVRGNIYLSAKQASIEESIPLATLKNRIYNPKKTDYYYI